jgi:HSP20 family protein
MEVVQMALVRWQSQSGREIESIQRDLNRIFGSLFDSHTAQPRGTRRWVPAIDLAEEGDHYVLQADLPGVKQDDVSIEVKDNVLSIAGERGSEHEETREGYYRVERASGSFRRSVRLPEGVSPEAIEASFEQGVLKVSIPKPVQAAAHKVAIAPAAPAAAVESAPQAPAA